MQLLGDPQTWLSFAVLLILEVVLGIDNLVFLSLTVQRLPPELRRRARLAGLSLAMLTRIALLVAVVGLATLRRPFAAPLGFAISPRDLVLFGGGVFLIVKSALELRGMQRSRGERAARDEQTARDEHAGTGPTPGLRRAIVQIALIDILFSFDSVFGAVGVARRVEVMLAAIVVSLPLMMGLSVVLERLIERHPSIKRLALGFLALVGFYLVVDAAHVELGRGSLYAVMAVAVIAETLTLVWRARR